MQNGIASYEDACTEMKWLITWKKFFNYVKIFFFSQNANLKKIIERQETAMQVNKTLESEILKKNQYGCFNVLKL